VIGESEDFSGRDFVSAERTRRSKVEGTRIDAARSEGHGGPLKRIHVRCGIAIESGRKLSTIAKMTNKAPTICYACDQPATTKEHAPPSSFFPEGERNNLITVPSCAEHNNATSKDVEYARNIISVMFGVNEIGERHFADKTLRSFDRSPALLHTTFSDIRGVQFRGMQVGAFTVDTERIKTVVKACIRALHFRETGWRARCFEPARLLV